MEEADDDNLDNLPKFTPFQKELLRSLKKKDLQLAQKLVILEETKNPIQFEEIIYNCFFHRYCWLKDEVKPLANLVELFLDCGAKVDYQVTERLPYMTKDHVESLFRCAVGLSKNNLTDLTRLMLEYGADPKVFICDGGPCVGLPSFQRHLDLVLLLMQFGSPEEFDEYAIEVWKPMADNDKEIAYITNCIQKERKSINEIGLKPKVIKVPTFSLWPEEERIKKLESNGWSSEKINELFESEKINSSVVQKFLTYIPELPPDYYYFYKPEKHVEAAGKLLIQNNEDKNNEKEKKESRGNKSSIPSKKMKK